jgi:hypothetical protein
MFIVTAALSMTVYQTTHPKVNVEKDQIKAYRKRMSEYADCPETIAEKARNDESQGKLAQEGVR